jgi:hypothetical protein
MLIKKYLWEKRTIYSDFAKEADFCKRSLTLYVNRAITPDLLTALKIHAISKGEISFVDILSDKDFQSLDKFIENIKSDDLKELKKLIKNSKKSRKDE